MITARGLGSQPGARSMPRRTFVWRRTSSFARWGAAPRCRSVGNWLSSSATGVARRLGWRGPFKPTEYVWSRGLALLCEHHGGLHFVRDQRGGRRLLPLDWRAYAQVKDGDLVWTRATALPEFLERALPHIDARFALLTGDEDWSIPGDFAGAAELCASDKLVCWFAQNFDGTDRSGKILPLPIGLDFHTLSRRRRWGHPQATPAEQETELTELRATMPPNEARRLRVHTDFHFNRHDRPVRWESRASIETTLRHNPLIDFPRARLPRLELWREKTRYAFVASPHGNGLDCHRTWESVALGNIVIVRRSPLDPLYEGLPVVSVNDWSEISAPALRAWQQQHARAFADPEVQRRLTNRYWIERVRDTLRERLTAPTAARSPTRADSAG
jgi:hypothetical protein